MSERAAAGLLKSAAIDLNPNSESPNPQTGRGRGGVGRAGGLGGLSETWLLVSQYAPTVVYT